MKKLLPKTANNPRGFTLVELMVVISIIAILSVIGITIYSNVQKSARDAKRKADIDAIAIAMEARFGSVTAGQYTPINANFFANNNIPLDPIEGCGAGCDRCNGTRCEYCAKSDATAAPAPVLCAGSWPATLESADGLGGTKPYWTVCANLEVDNSGPGGMDYYCKQSQQ